MQPIKKILVPVDFSDYSLPSVQYASELAEASGAQLILLNVYNQRNVRAIQNTLGAYYDANYCERIVEEKLGECRLDMEKLAKSAGVESSAIQMIARVGIPYQVILDVIKEENPDLLVMCTKGRSNLADTIVGSCAQKMYRRSPIPMLSLRPEV